MCKYVIGSNESGRESRSYWIFESNFLRHFNRFLFFRLWTLSVIIWSSSLGGHRIERQTSNNNVICSYKCSITCHSFLICMLSFVRNSHAFLFFSLTNKGWCRWTHEELRKSISMKWQEAAWWILPQLNFRLLLECLAVILPVNRVTCSSVEATCLSTICVRAVPQIKMWVFFHLVNTESVKLLL